MKRIIKLFVIVIIFSSCQYKVDNSNIFEIGNAINQSLNRNDTSIMKQVMPLISTMNDKKVRAINPLYMKNIELVKMDTSSFHFYGISWSNLDIFYKEQESFYRVRAEYEKDSSGNYFVNQFYVANINEECEKYLDKPYAPDEDIVFKQISWQIDYSGNTFKSGYIEVQNNTDFDLSYLKFTVILQNGYTTSTAKTFFKQTIEHNDKIYKGDIAIIDIPSLKNYYAGFKVTKDNLIFLPELIEVKPKPESYWCKTIVELKNAIINESE